MLTQYRQGNVTQKCCTIELFQHKIDTYKRTLRMGYWLILLEFLKKVYKNNISYSIFKGRRVGPLCNLNIHIKLQPMHCIAQQIKL